MFDFYSKVNFGNWPCFGPIPFSLDLMSLNGGLIVMIALDYECVPIYKVV